MPENLDEYDWNHATNLFYQLIGHKYAEGAVINGLTLRVRPMGTVCFYLSCLFTPPNHIHIDQVLKRNEDCPVFDYLLEGNSVYRNVV